MSDSVPETMHGMHGIGSLTWVPGKHGSIPELAVFGREDKEAPDMAVGRTWFKRDLIPGPIMLTDGCIYIAMDGSDNKREEYEVLTNPEHCKLAWVESKHGAINKRAVPGGHNKKDGCTYYIGRHKHEGHLILGRVHPTTHELWIPYNGKEFKYSEYEVLVCDS